MHTKSIICMWSLCRVWSSGTLLGDPDHNQSEPRLQRWRCWCGSCLVVENHYFWSSSQPRRATLWCTSWTAMDFAVYQGKWNCDPYLGCHYRCVSWSNNRDPCSLGGCQKRSCSCARLSFCFKDASAVHSSCSRMAQQYIACSLDGCQKRSFSCARLSFCSEAVSAVFNNIASVSVEKKWGPDEGGLDVD